MREASSAIQLQQREISKNEYQTQIYIHTNYYLSLFFHLSLWDKFKIQILKEWGNNKLTKEY